MENFSTWHIFCTSLMWRNFSTWQIFSTFLMWRNFPLDRFVSTFLMWRNFSMWQSFPTFIIWRIFPLDMSWGEFLHMTNFSPQTPSVVSVTNIRYVESYLTHLEWIIQAFTLQYAHPPPHPKLNTPLEKWQKSIFFEIFCMILHPTPHIRLFGSKKKF